MKGKAYEAHGEKPLILCSYGKTPGQAMKAMAKIIDQRVREDENTLVLGMNSMYDEDGIFNMNVTISPWK